MEQVDMYQDWRYHKHICKMKLNYKIKELK